jgi:hypothetical protein
VSVFGRILVTDRTDAGLGIRPSPRRQVLLSLLVGMILSTAFVAAALPCFEEFFFHGLLLKGFSTSWAC